MSRDDACSVYLSNNVQVTESVTTILVKNERGGWQVEVGEGSHDSIVNVLVVFLGELVRDQPRNRLTTDLSLVVVAADGDEALS